MADHPLKSSHKKPKTPTPSPASLLRNVKEKAALRNPINRGKPTKNPSPEEILRAKKKSIAKKERR